MNKIIFSSLRMDWETPQKFFDRYHLIHNFTLDVCAGRLKFKGKNSKGETVNNSATFPSAIIIFGCSKAV